MLAWLVLATIGSGVSFSRAQIDITPPEPLPLGGYTERGGKASIPGGDPLFARALALRGPGARIVVVSVETLTIPESLRREVAAKLPPDVRLFLAATHTHCAPDSQMLNDRMTFSVPGIATFKRRWLDWTAERVAQVARAALAAPGSGLARPVAVMGHLDRNHTRRAQDVPDRALVRVLPDEGAPLFWHYAMHPVFYGPDELHARGDWPGRLAEEGGGIVLLGAIGDVSPNLRKTPPAEQIEGFVADCLKIAGTRLALGEAPLRWAEAPIALGPKTPHPSFAKTYGVPQALAKLAVNQFAPDTASISAFRWGKLAVVGVPGEPTAAIGRQIRDAGLRLGFSVVLVTSHVNGWIGYILEPEDYDRGGYEANLAMHGRDAGPKVVAAAVAALRQLADRR